MNIIVDAFGGDNAPLEIIKGCVEAVAEYNINVTLTGDETKIKNVFSENSLSMNNIDICHCTQKITMEDSAESVLKEKKDSSMAVGLRLLNEGKGDAFVSAGNSGALCVGATLAIKRIKGIKRPAFAPVMPSESGFFMLMDGISTGCIIRSGMRFSTATSPLRTMTEVSATATCTSSVRFISPPFPA